MSVLDGYTDIQIKKTEAGFKLIGLSPNGISWIGAFASNAGGTTFRDQKMVGSIASLAASVKLSVVVN